MEAVQEDSGALSWTWLCVYFTAAYLFDLGKSCFFRSSRPVARRALLAYYLLTYFLSFCRGLMAESVYLAELYFVYILVGMEVVKGLRVGHYVGLMVFWQFMIVSGLVICRVVGITDVSDLVAMAAAKAEIALIDVQTASPMVETVPSREITHEIEGNAGFSWVWLCIYVALALLADWIRACMRFRGNFHAIRALIAYYCLNYLLSLCSDYITGGWFLLDYYFICLLAVSDVVTNLDFSDYVGILFYWHFFLGAIRVFLHVSGLSAASGWGEQLISWVIVPLSVLILKYGLCTAFCFFISLYLLHLISQFSLETYAKPKSPQEVSRFAVDFFQLLFLVLGLMLLAWTLMWGCDWLFGTVPWLMQFWYKAVWALLGAGLAYMLVERDSYGREMMLANNFVATLISLYVLGGLASLAF